MYGTQPGTPEMSIGQGNGQAGLTAEPPKRVSELQNQISRLNDNLQHLEKSLGNLYPKLQPILSPAVPQGENKKDQDSMSTEVGKLLQQFNFKLEQITFAINDITKRLEI